MIYRGGREAPHHKHKQGDATKLGNKDFIHGARPSVRCPRPGLVTDCDTRGSSAHISDDTSSVTRDSVTLAAVTLTAAIRHTSQRQRCLRILFARQTLGFVSHTEYNTRVEIKCEISKLHSNMQKMLSADDIKICGSESLKE